MSAFSDYAESQVGAALLNGGSYTGGAVFFGLLTTAPTDANTGTEMSDSGYVRQQAHDSIVSDGFTEAPVGTFKNANTIEFPEIADGPSVTVSHLGIYDLVSGGNLLLHAELNAPKTFDTSDIPRFSVGQAEFIFA